MIKKEKVIVVDVDGTITLERDDNICYSKILPSTLIRSRLITLKEQGYWIILYTSRNMNTYDGNIGLILKYTAPILIDWLNQHEIPFDELHFGKPWCGNNGYYIDDRAIRPKEFLDYSDDEIRAILFRDRAQ